MRTIIMTFTVAHLVLIMGLFLLLLPLVILDIQWATAVFMSDTFNVLFATSIYSMIVMLIAASFSDLPRQTKVNEWRRNVKIGDKCYFNNMRGTQTEVTIQKLDAQKKTALIVNSNSSQWMELDSLFPLLPHP